MDKQSEILAIISTIESTSYKDVSNPTEWLPLSSINDIYFISNTGLVFSIRAKRLMHRCDNGGGYLITSLINHNTKKRKSYKVHRLVAESFISNPENFDQINHINGIKTDNRVENLEWCNNSMNQIHAWANGLNKGKTGNIGVLNKMSIPVFQLSISGEIIKKWGSARDVERATGYKNSNIARCIKNKRPTAYGYKWNYASQ